MTSEPKAQAAPIQTRLAGHPWQVVQGETVVGHYSNHRTATATAEQVPGTTVRWVG